MSLYIKGIDIPTYESEEVIVRIKPNGKVYDAHNIRLDAKAIEVQEGVGASCDAFFALLRTMAKMED